MATPNEEYWNRPINETTANEMQRKKSQVGTGFMQYAQRKLLCT